MKNLQQLLTAQALHELYNKAEEARDSVDLPKSDIYMFCFHAHYDELVMTAWVKGSPEGMMRFVIDDTGVHINHSGKYDIFTAEEVQKIIATWLLSDAA